ncbi:PD-(D/E)XK nuclease family protein, partial [bacterium]|nr:PD-(D/E)XK nuclease family protein [bacterium]MBU3956297.1 PD-(D/E)XK nuclease family protein [bacterium]
NLTGPRETGLKPGDSVNLTGPRETGLKPGDSVNLTGRIDRMDIIPGEGMKTLHITDYKSGKNELSEEELKNDIQLKFYIYAAFLLYKKHHRNIRFTLSYLRDGNEISFETSQPEIFRGEIENIIERILSDKSYPKNPGPLCKHCPALKLCKPEIQNE